jgi:phenylacetate-CoA ligase
MLGRETFPILKQLRRSQWYEPSQLRDLQLARLRHLLGDAQRHTKYWHDVMRGRDLDADQIESIEDLRRLPLLDKSVIRSARDRMVWTEGERRVQMARTSGSTNEPLEFYTGADREAHINAARIRGHEWVGISKGQREMYFWGCPVELEKTDRLRQIRDFLINDALTSAFDLTEEDVETIWRRWMRWMPEVIFCYPSSLMRFTSLARRRGIDLAELGRGGLQCIVTTAETLGPARETLEEAFGVPVFDSYGLREVGLIGHECSHKVMHAIDEQVLLETIDPESQEPTEGEGELVVTNLVGRAMPMIRYRTGDMVRLKHGTCECGRSLTQLEVSGGRITDHLVTSQGRWVSGIVLVYLTKHIPGVEKLQAVQDRVGEIRLRLVTNDAYTAESEKHVRRDLQARLKSDDRIVLEYVDRIPPAPSGKHRLVISHLNEGRGLDADRSFSGSAPGH